jgi:hypothetical protein
MNTSINKKTQNLGETIMNQQNKAGLKNRIILFAVLGVLFHGGWATLAFFFLTDGVGVWAYLEIILGAVFVTAAIAGAVVLMRRIEETNVEVHADGLRGTVMGRVSIFALVFWITGWRQIKLVQIDLPFNQIRKVTAKSDGLMITTTQPRHKGFKCLMNKESAEAMAQQINARR